MAMDLTVDDAGVHLRFDGFDAALALARTVDLAPEQITGARVATRRELLRDVKWRVGGSAWPGSLTTGWYTWRDRKGYRQLWWVFRDKELLAVDTTLVRPARLVIQHPDRAALAERIQAMARPPAAPPAGG